MLFSVDVMRDERERCVCVRVRERECVCVCERSSCSSVLML